MKSVMSKLNFCLLNICALLVSFSTAASTSETVIIWAQSFGVWSKFRGLNPQNLNSSSQLSGSQPLKNSQFLSVAHNPRTDAIYWTDEFKEGIIFLQNRLKTFNWASNDETKLNASSNKIRHFTVDWASDNIYFIDSRGVILVITESKGKAMTNIIHSIAMDNPVSIVCDVVKGLLFWIDASANYPRIESSVLNGSSRRIVISGSSVILPSSIAILKHGGSQLFWVDERLQGIMSCDYDGNNFKSILTFASNAIPRGLAVIEEYIFMTDESTLSVEMFKSGQQMKSIILDAHPNDVIVATENDPNFKHDCDELECERFCFNIGFNKGQCGCDGADDDTSCSGLEFIFSSPDKVLLASMDTNISESSSSNDHLKVYMSSTTTQQLNATFIDFHYFTKSFIWGDQSSGSIYKMAGTSQIPGSLTLRNAWEITAQQTSIEGLVINWMDSLLLWIDVSVGHIMGSTFEGSYHSIYANHLNEPQALAVDPIAGIIYWSQKNEIQREIVFMSYHGDKEIQQLIELNHSEVGDLVLDIKMRKLYWSDSFSLQIHCLHLDSKVMVTYSLGINYLNKFTVFEDFVIPTHPASMQPAKEPLVFLTYWNNTHFNRKVGVQFLLNHANLTDELANTTGDIVVNGNYLQPRRESSACSVDNPCEQVCMAAGNSPICRCAIGYKEDGYKCRTNVLSGTAIYFADTYHKQVYQISSSLPPDNLNQIYKGMININSTFAFPHLTLIRPTMFVVNGNKGLVYIVDMGQIKVSDVSKEKLEIIYPTNQNSGVSLNITQIALDKEDDSLYITDISNQIIAKCDLKTKNISIWKEQLENPFAVAVDSNKRLLYWSEGGHLKSAALNDRNNVTLHISLENITSIDVISEENIVYVSDLNEGSIILYNLTDTNLLRLYQNRSWRIFKIASDELHIYFVCWNKRGVYRISRLNQSADAELLSAPIFSRIIDIAFVPVFVLSDEYSVIPLILGVFFGLFFLLLLIFLLLLLLFYLRQKRKKQTNHNLPPNNIVSSNGTIKDELRDVSNNTMFYPRLNTQSIIPNEWEDESRHNLSDNITSGTGSDVLDNSIEVPLRASLLFNEAGIPKTSNSRELLRTRPKDPILRSTKDPILRSTKDPILRSTKDPVGLSLPGAGPSGHNDIFSSGGDSPSNSSTQHDPIQLDQSEPSRDLSITGPNGQPINLIGPERGKDAPTGRFVLIPPKLHVQPRGFAPASHSVPAAIRNTWGRMRNATKLKANFDELNSKC